MFLLDKHSLFSRVQAIKRWEGQKFDLLCDDNRRLFLLFDLYHFLSYPFVTRFAKFYVFVMRLRFWPNTEVFENMPDKRKREKTKSHDCLLLSHFFRRVFWQT